MEIELLLALTGLALIDSTSIGTLFIPVWLLMSSAHVSASRLLLYLFSIAVFYLGVGVLLITGAASAVAVLGGAVNSTIALWIQLGMGVALFVISFRFDSKRQGSSHRVERWRERTQAATASVKWLMALAIMAGLAEVATMLPYLGAIAMLTSAELAFPQILLLLAAYCLVMVLPACLLLVIRIISDVWLQPRLQRLNDWLGRNAESALGWMLGIVGVILVLEALERLWMPG